MFTGKNLSEYRAVLLTGFAVVEAILFALWGASFPLRRAAWEREQAWLGSLPFTVTGYLRTIGSDSIEGDAMALDIEFSGPRPAPELIASAIQGASLEERFPFTVTEPSRKLRVSINFQIKVKHGYSRASNRRMLLYFHDLCEKLLRPLHSAHPIREVRLSVDAGW